MPHAPGRADHATFQAALGHVRTCPMQAKTCRAVRARIHATAWARARKTMAKSARSPRNARAAFASITCAATLHAMRFVRPAISRDSLVHVRVSAWVRTISAHVPGQRNPAMAREHVNWRSAPLVRCRPIVSVDFASMAIAAIQRVRARVRRVLHWTRAKARTVHVAPSSAATTRATNARMDPAMARAHASSILAQLV